MDGKSLFMQWFRKEVRSISIGPLCHRPRHDEVLMAWKESQWVSLCKSCDSALSLENQHCRQMFRECIIQKNSKKVFINTFRYHPNGTYGRQSAWRWWRMVLLHWNATGYVCLLSECKALIHKKLHILVHNLCKDRPGPMPKVMQTGQINRNSCFLCRYKDLSMGRFLQENGWLIVFISFSLTVHHLCYLDEGMLTKPQNPLLLI